MLSVQIHLVIRQFCLAIAHSCSALLLSLRFDLASLLVLSLRSTSPLSSFYPCVSTSPLSSFYPCVSTSPLSSFYPCVSTSALFRLSLFLVNLSVSGLRPSLSDLFFGLAVLSATLVVCDLRLA